MADIEKFQVMDEFTMYRGEDWNAEGCAENARGYWVKYDEHKKIVEWLEADLREARNAAHRGSMAIWKGM